MNVSWGVRGVRGVGGNGYNQYSQTPARETDGRMESMVREALVNGLLRTLE